MLKREEILSKSSLKKEVLTIKEWGGDVIVSEMSGSMRDAWEQAITEKDSLGKLVSPRAKLIAFTVVDEEGNRVFKDGDIESIGKISSKILEKILIVAMRLNSLGADEIDSAKKN
jgi:hypothetical protein